MSGVLEVLHMVATVCSTDDTKITLDGGRILTLFDPFRNVVCSPILHHHHNLFA